MASRYRPPEQSRGGQIFDGLFLLALVYLALFLPLVLGLTGGGTVVEKPDKLTWEAIGQNPTMQAQWEKLGYSLEDAAAIVTERFDYTIDPFMLIITALVIIGYFAFMLLFSEKEYLEVIAEKFDAADEKGDGHGGSGS